MKTVMAARNVVRFLSLSSATYPMLLSCVSRRTISHSTPLQVSFVYDVIIKTGNHFGAGTDANIYLRIIGEKGSTDEIKLKTKKSDLERSMVNVYNFPADDVGKLKKLIIRHDNSGFGPAWHLDEINIRDGRGQLYTFVCDSWISKNETDEPIKLLQEVNYYSTSSDSNREVDHLADKISTEDEAEGERLEGAMMNFAMETEDIDGFDEEDIPYVTVNNDADTTVPQAMHQSTKHASSLSPAVKHLVESYGIDFFKIQPSGPHSRLLKGDVLSFMKEENITEKLKVIYEVPKVAVITKKEIQVPQHSTDTIIVSEAANQTAYDNHAIQSTKTFLDDTFKIPQIYLSSNCVVENFVKCVEELNNTDIEDNTKILISRILCQAVSEIGQLRSVGEHVNIKVTTGTEVFILSECEQCSLEKLQEKYQKYKDSKATIPSTQYSINIMEEDGVSQLSSVLENGQILSFNYGGAKLSVDVNGDVIRSSTISLTCDCRAVSDDMAALLLGKIKNYISNPLKLVL